MAHLKKSKKLKWEQERRTKQGLTFFDCQIHLSMEHCARDFFLSPNGIELKISKQIKTVD